MSPRPPVIAAFLGTQALGDFVMCLLTSISFARSFPGSKLVAIYRDDRPYKSPLIMMAPDVTTSLALPDNADSVIPLDWFDGELNVPGRPFNEEWYGKNFHKPDIFLTPNMLLLSRCIGSPPRLRIPCDMEEPLTDVLRSLGLDENRWFVCLHMREAGYRHRRNVDLLKRSVDAQSYLPMIENIINKQGGQVVRLGDPSMTPLPEMKGLIDLSRFDDCFTEQAFALNHARYFIGTDTGMTQLASALKIPTATTNIRGIGVWNDGDVALFKRVILPGGEMVNHGEDLKVTNFGMPPEIPFESKIIDNPPRLLTDVANHMFDTTSDCSGWRTEPKEPTPETSGTLTLPAPWRHISEFANLTYWEVDGVQ